MHKLIVKCSMGYTMSFEFKDTSFVELLDLLAMIQKYSVSHFNYEITFE